MMMNLSRVWMAASLAVVNGHSGHGEKLKSDVADVRLFAGVLAGSGDHLRRRCCWEKKQTDESLRQLCSSESGVSQALLVKPMKINGHGMGKDKRMKVKCMAASIPADDGVPDMEKRNLMNLLLLGALALPTGGMLVPYATFFAPPGSGGGSSGTIVKDATGNDVVVTEWLKTHAPGTQTLTQGLKGDPTYLVVENDGTLATYGINAVCTHLGCVVPWNTAENKFICPCHGSQYNNQGKVVRGPAPLSLALAHADIDDGKVVFIPWVETDFRTGDAPWWA